MRECGYCGPFFIFKLHVVWAGAAAAAAGETNGRLTGAVARLCTHRDATRPENHVWSSYSGRGYVKTNFSVFIYLVYHYVRSVSGLLVKHRADRQVSEVESSKLLKLKLWLETEPGSRKKQNKPTVKDEGHKENSVIVFIFLHIIQDNYFLTQICWNSNFS